MDQVDKNDFIKYLLTFGEYAEYELSSYLIHGRHFDGITAFLHQFFLLISKDEKYNIGSLRQQIPAMKKYLGGRILNVDLGIHHARESINTSTPSNNKYLDLMSDTEAQALVNDNSMLFLFHLFFRAYDYLERSVGKHNPIETPVVEFYNFISHMLTAYLRKSTKETNIRAAKAHLYRGALDCYKLFINAHKEELKSQTGYCSELRGLRQEECLGIGNRKSEKEMGDLITAYHGLIVKMPKYNSEHKKQ
ncbi:hypothetical protein [Chrysiogenes arsenatis]|uniref:hypothetical protein n=1 Tax=Chrysiogenes arsenatis TaxID=309797 RepID=UPI0004094D60|nr:hypothetical protein [Chrysiogenes arsenatis]